MTGPQLRRKTRTSISRKIGCLKSGFQIFYEVEQFSSLFSKDNLKQGAHLYQTHDPPSPHMSWESCRSVPSQQLPHMLCETGTERTCLCRKGSLYTAFPQSVTDSYAMGETAVHGCHCPRDMAVHVGEVMARPLVGACVPLALIYW